MSYEEFARIASASMLPKPSVEHDRMRDALSHHVARLSDDLSRATETLLRDGFADPAVVAVDVARRVSATGFTLDARRVMSLDEPPSFDDCTRYARPAPGAEPFLTASLQVRPPRGE